MTLHIAQSHLKFFFDADNLTDRVSGWTPSFHDLQTSDGPSGTGGKWIRFTGGGTPSASTNYNYTGSFTLFGWWKGTGIGSDSDAQLLYDTSYSTTRYFSLNSWQGFFNVEFGAATRIALDFTAGENWRYLVMVVTPTGSTSYVQNGSPITGVTTQGFDALRFLGPGFARVGMLDFAVTAEEAEDLWASGNGAAYADFPAGMNETGSGGIRGGGLCLNFKETTLIASGGASTGGSAAAPQTYSETGSGGIGAGSTALASLIAFHSGSGGAGLAGTAVVSQVIGLFGNGPAQCAGSSEVTDFIMARGGIRAGGSAPPLSSTFATGSGGIRAAGRAKIGTTLRLTISGRTPNQINFPMLFRLPLGGGSSLSAEQDGESVPVSLVYFDDLEWTWGRANVSLKSTSSELQVTGETS